MRTENTGYVSNFALAQLHILVESLKILLHSPVKKPNDVQTSTDENGHSCITIIAALLLFESVINRTSYIRNEKIEKGIESYFFKISTNTDLAKDIKEIIAVRDAITHNHLWECKVYWDDNNNLKFDSRPKLLEGYGNKRLHSVLNQNTLCTKKLSLNLFPPRIWRRDSFIIVKKVSDSLKMLEQMDRRYFYLSPQYFQFNGKPNKFDNIISDLPLYDFV